MISPLCFWEYPLNSELFPLHIILLHSPYFQPLEWTSYHADVTISISLECERSTFWNFLEIFPDMSQASFCIFIPFLCLNCPLALGLTYPFILRQILTYFILFSVWAYRISCSHHLLLSGYSPLTCLFEGWVARKNTIPGGTFSLPS